VRSRTSAAPRPSNSPTIAPLARNNGTLGRLGAVGSWASLMIFPGVTCAVDSSFSRLVSVLTWPVRVAIWLFRSALLGSAALSPASRLDSCDSVAEYCLTLASSAEICAVRSACAVVCRFWRYAMANACDPDCASFGAGAA